MNAQASAVLTSLDRNSLSEPPRKISHTTPVTRLEDNKLATDFGLSILHRRIDEIAEVIETFNKKNLPATECWTKISEILHRG